MNKRKRLPATAHSDDREGSSSSPESPQGPAKEPTPVQLSELKFSAPLSGITDLPRKECGKCKRKRKYYCYNCVLPIYPERHQCDLRLPLQLHVYKHFKEKNSRTTSLHAAIVSPDVHIYTYPDLGPDLDPSETLVLYPSPDAVPLSEVEDLTKYKNAVVIEATWQQSGCISREPKVCQFKRIRLDHHTSIFWRYQRKDDTFLATIEAIYFFFVEYRNAVLAKEGSETRYAGEYDDLLFFYSHMYQTIQNAYKADPTLEYTPWGRPNYIHYGDDDPILQAADSTTAVRPAGDASAPAAAATPCSGSETEPAGAEEAEEAVSAPALP